MPRPTLIGAPVTGEAFYLEDGNVRVLTRDAHGQVVEVLEGDLQGVTDVLLEDDRRHAAGHVRRRWSLLYYALHDLQGITVRELRTLED